MEKELKEYLRLTGIPEERIAEMEQNATEEQLNAVRSFAETLGGKPLPQLARQTAQRQQEQEAAIEKARKDAQRKTREERARKKSQFALGFGIIPMVMLVTMLISAVMPTESHEPSTKAEKEAVVLAEQWAESEYTAKSYNSTIERLISLGYSKTEAKVAADYCGADWNEQALKYAKIQLNSDPNLTGGDLRAFLSLEGFTSEEIQYALDHCR